MLTKDGQKLELDRLKAVTVEICKNIPYVNPELIIEKTQKNLYDGISKEQLMSTLISSAEILIEVEPEYSKVATRLFLRKLKKEVLGGSGANRQTEQAYREGFVQSIELGVKLGILDTRMLEYDLVMLSDCLSLDRDNLLEYIAINTLYNNYLMKDGDRRIELPQHFWMRVSMGLALNEPKEIRTEKALQFYSQLSQLYSIPSTPTLFHAGYVHSQCCSCVLSYVDDSLEHIMKCAGDNAQLAKYSYGIGTDITAVRGTGALIKTTRVESQGIIPFLKIYNDVTLAINRSGKRRGAAAFYLECWHWDFEDFLDLKRNTGDERRRTHDLHTAAWVPDLFMKRVNEDGMWTLFSPDEVPDLHDLYGAAFERRYIEYEQMDKEQIRLQKRVKARTLYRKMLTSLFETGGPFICWKDPSNVRSPQSHVGVVHSSNLCTEIIENTSPDESACCNLQSINLSEFVYVREDDNLPYINFTHLSEVIRNTVRMLDNVIDLNFYPTKETKNANFRHRPIGMGLMGWQDMLFKLKIPFDSPDAISLADKLTEFISYEAINASSDLAKERGAYPTFAGSKWDEGIFPLDTLDLLEKERGEPIQVNRDSWIGKERWDNLKAKVKRQGMRNSNLFAIAPTVSISLLAGCYPSIEPIYSNIYTKSNKSGEYTVINKYLVEDLRKMNLWSTAQLNQLKHADGDISRISEIPKDIRDLYKKSFVIDPIHAIKMTAVRGKWIDQSQSHNVFVPANVGGKKLSEIYKTAWSMGLKTTYYCRTLGASGTEKVAADTTALTQLRNQKTVEEPKACSIDNPDCESCQ